MPSIAITLAMHTGRRKLCRNVAASTASLRTPRRVDPTGPWQAHDSGTLERPRAFGEPAGLDGRADGVGIPPGLLA
eukprot:7268556-Pyramimonas_sp.AAC.1